MDHADFLPRLFGRCPAGFWFYLWTAKDKRSLWFPLPNGIPQAWETATTTLRDTDVYFGVAIARENLGPQRRATSEEAAGIVGLWADVDIKGPQHKKPNLPQSLVSATSLVDAMPRRPTVLVHSGHGLHAWWLFAEPWLFSSDDDRRKAAARVCGWQTLLRQKARGWGWTVDGTHDLARVLRLPGTMNWKDRERPVPACVMRSEDD